MVGAVDMGRDRWGFRPEGLGDFLEAAYCFEGDDQIWWRRPCAPPVRSGDGAVRRTACSTTPPIRPSSGWRAFNSSTARQRRPGADDRSFAADPSNDSPHVPPDRCRLYVGAAAPQLGPMLKAMTALGYSDALNINGMDPSGLGVYFALWGPEHSNLSRGELAFYRRWRTTWGRRTDAGGDFVSSKRALPIRRLARRPSSTPNIACCTRSGRRASRTRRATCGRQRRRVSGAGAPE